MFLFFLVTSANLVLNGTTYVLTWLLLPAYTRIINWPADTRSKKKSFICLS